MPDNSAQTRIEDALNTLRAAAPEIDFDQIAAELRAVAAGRSPEADVDIMLERVIEKSDFLPEHFLEVGAERARAVARITRGGRAHGTGFLIGGDMLMTNNHVIDENSDLSDHAAEFNYRFNLDFSKAPPDIFEIEPDGLIVTSRALDYSVLRLKRKVASHIWRDGSEPPGANILGPRIETSVSPGERWGAIPLREPKRGVKGELPVNIIQHPQGRRKELAVQNNETARIDSDFVLYITDTEPGSSGSPVFNNQWELVALHHAGGDRDPVTNRWLNNEGIIVTSLINDLHTRLGDSDEGKAVLVALGLRGA